MNIAVTGANGYLGRGITKALLDLGHSVTAADLSVENVDGRAEKLPCSIFELDDPYEKFGRPDVLLHLAWRNGFVHYDDSHIADLGGHYLFLKKLFESDIKKVAAMGSMHEIGFFEGSIREDTPCRPVTPYGIGKNALRQLTEMMSVKYGVAYQWLRGFYIVGNSRFGSSVFSKIADAAYRDQKEFPFTLGQNQYDFLDYDVFCRMAAEAVTQDEINGIINICSGHPEKLADRAERFIKENGFEIKLKYGAFPDRAYDSKAVWGDSTKIDEIMSRAERR